MVEERIYDKVALYNYEGECVSIFERFSEKINRREKRECIIM